MTSGGLGQSDGPPSLSDGYVRDMKLLGNRTYTGEVSGGRLHGYGVLTTELDVYRGGFFENLRHGHGVFSSLVEAHPTGVVMYNGDWHMDERHGSGVIKWCSGDTYTGTFFKGKPHCVSGCYTFADGRVYRGEYRMGVRHGIGRLTQTNGEYYEGEFKESSMTGWGKGWYDRGKRLYEGLWKDGKKVRGRMTFQGSKRMYDGEWMNEKPHGVGEMVFENGDHYVGELNMGKMHGSGSITYHSAGGKVYKGTFLADQPHGKGAVTMPDGAVVEGYFQSGRKIEADDMETIQQVMRETASFVTPGSCAQEVEKTDKGASPPKRVRFVFPTSAEVLCEHDKTSQKRTEWEWGETSSWGEMVPSASKVREPSAGTELLTVTSSGSSLPSGGMAEIFLPTLPSVDCDAVALKSQKNGDDNNSGSISRLNSRDKAEITAIVDSVIVGDFLHGCKGWMNKFSIGRRRIGRFNWRRRYFILVPFRSLVSLSYYKDELCRKPVASFLLNPNDTRIVTRPSPRTHLEATMPGREICVIYQERGREYKLLLRVDSPEDYVCWVDALRELFDIIDYPLDFPL